MRYSVYTLTLVLFYYAHSDTPSTKVSPEFGFTEIENLVRSRKISTVEDLLENLPPVFLRNYSLLFRSRSPNPSGHLDPRIILFAPGVNTFIGLNSGERQERADLVEIIDFDIELNQFRFNGLEFTNGRARKLNAAETQKCLGCHSSGMSLADAHPIWDSYPNWPGSYGSMHLTNSNDREFLGPINQRYGEFKAQNADHPRYRLLHRIDRDQDSLALMSMGLGNQIARSIHSRVARSITQSPKFVRYRSAFLALNLGSGKYFVANGDLNAEDIREFTDSIQNIQSAIEQRQDRYYRSKFFRLARNNGLGNEPSPSLRSVNYDRRSAAKYARLEFLLYKLGLSPISMEMSLERRSYAWVQGEVTMVDLTEKIEDSCRLRLTSSKRVQREPN